MQRRVGGWTDGPKLQVEETLKERRTRQRPPGVERLDWKGGKEAEEEDAKRKMDGRGHREPLELEGGRERRGLGWLDGSSGEN
jgi:hypothetical protein